MIIRNLRKTYRGRTVLELDEFTFEPDRIYAIVGANGSGKSTFAKILAGAIEADEKNCILGADALQIGYLPQHPFAFSMKVIDNLLLGLGKKEADRAQALLEKLDIAHLAASPAHKLSGGETARMALGRVMIRHSDLLILDEPTAAMDIRSTLSSESLLLEYKKEHAATILLITHSVQQAHRIADELLFFQEGHLMEYGGCRQMLQSPKTPAFREFLEFYSI